MVLVGSWLTAACLWGQVVLAGPAGEAALALADLERRVPASAWCETRYLSLYALPEEARSEARGAISFLLNSVSRSATIVRPSEVPGSGGRLWRIELGRYGLDGALWEAVASRDPYWHLRTEVLDPQSGRRREVYTDGGWVGLEKAAALRRMTGSGGAVLRGDFFVAVVATTADGGLYYEFAGVPEREAEFFAQLGVDVKTIGALRGDAGANLIFSGVTRKVRRVVRRQGPLGGAWQTYDVSASTAERDPIRNPFGFDYEASEHIATKANGLHLFGLYDRQGKRQDSVAAEIAKDHQDTLGDGVVVPLVSCVRCHREDGLRPFVNDQWRLISAGVELYTQRVEDADRLAAFYGANLERRLRRDREDYAEAVAAATEGMTPAEAADALDRVFGGYRYRLVTAETAQRELGVGPERFAERLAGSTDPVVLALVTGMRVQRQQWEASFAEAAALVAGGE